MYNTFQESIKWIGRRKRQLKDQERDEEEEKEGMQITREENSE